MFHGYLFMENAWQKYVKGNGIGAWNPANWLVNSRRTRQTNFCAFDQTITGAIYFTFHDGKNRLSIVQITRQFECFTLRFLWRQNVASIQSAAYALRENLSNRCSGIRIPRDVCAGFGRYAYALRENLSNRSSGIRIPRDICTGFGRYLYSTKCSWIININILQLGKSMNWALYEYTSTIHHNSQRILIWLNDTGNSDWFTKLWEQLIDQGLEPRR